MRRGYQHVEDHADPEIGTNPIFRRSIEGYKTTGSIPIVNFADRKWLSILEVGLVTEDIPYEMILDWLPNYEDRDSRLFVAIRYPKVELSGMYMKDQLVDPDVVFNGLSLESDRKKEIVKLNKNGDGVNESWRLDLSPELQAEFVRSVALLAITTIGKIKPTES